MADALDAQKRIVAAGYDTAIERYASLESKQAEWPRMRWLRDLLARLADGAAVLDIGCGTGVGAAEEIGKRHRVTGIDVSPEQVRRARKNIPTGTFICGDATEVDVPACAFDAVVSFYTFDHIPRSQHSLLLSRIHDWLKPGGYLLLSVEDADQPGAVTEWLGVDMFFSMFEAARTLELVREAGFTIIDTTVEHQIEGDVEVPYVWVLARKPQPRAGV